MTAFTACWDAEDARKILVTEALEGDDAIFLATHSPITGFDVDGRDAVDIQGRDEQAVLDEISEKALLADRIFESAGSRSVQERIRAVKVFRTA